MRFFLLMAFRNMLRRKLRSGLTVAMIAAGTALIVFMVGFSEGVYSDLVEVATKSWAGHFQIMVPGFLDKPSLFDNIDDADQLADRLVAEGKVEAATPRVETAGLISLGIKTSGAMVVGADPVREPTVTSISDSMINGGWFSPDGGKEIILGTGLAKRLQAKVGHEVSFVGQAADGSIAAELYTVKGIFESGSPEMDFATAMISISAAREVLSLGKKAHRIVGRFPALEMADLPGGGLTLPKGIKYFSWREVMPSLDRSIKTDRFAVRIVLSVLLSVVILGVVNTMVLVIMERTHELGVMAALGTSPARLVALVLLEAAWLSILGVAIGIALGSYANHHWATNGIAIMEDPVAFGGVLLKEMHTRNTFSAVVGAPLIVFCAALLGALVPAFRAARLKPVAALRR